MASAILYAFQHLSGNQDLLASAVIELAMDASMNAWESAG
jgi:hypothetical protein